MLRKLASLFFEEEEEIVEEEEIEAKGPQLPPIAKVAEKKTPRVELETVHDVKPLEMAKLPPIGETVVKTPKHIEIGPEIILKPKRSVSENKVVYEFQPVISPIFGISEKDRKSVVVANSTPQQPTQHSPLQTIISPIYGVMKNNEVANEEFTQPVIPAANLTLDIKNFTLDEILHEEETAAKQKSLEQFSLFEDNPDM